MSAMALRHGDRLILLGAALLMVTFLGGCAIGGIGIFDGMAQDEAVDTGEDPDLPLGGEALAHRKLDMGRAMRDMRHFHATLRSLIQRSDDRGYAVFDEFLAKYMGTHLDPMLRPNWQSSHPELMVMDANLRFMEAEMLAMMRYPRRVQDAIDEIEDRYEGRETMLIDYPIGDQTTLAEALQYLRERKWRS
jgi:hypothetical protein